jgi:peptide deformylase
MPIRSIFERLVPFAAMAIFPIRVYPDPVLRSEAATVEVFDEELQRLADDMLETMYDAPGVGLAAPQIGISKRMFVADIGDGPMVMVNPEIVEVSGQWEFEEGCLSIPEHWWEFARPSFARAVGRDLEGKPVEYAGEELMGRVLQHETDHLHGKLLIDRLGRSARKRALAELREAMAEDRLGRA